jgi:hypothetical protein
MRASFASSPIKNQWSTAFSYSKSTLKVKGANITEEMKVIMQQAMTIDIVIFL